MLEPLLSICIPCYNRPEKLCILLNSIDCFKDEIEISVENARRQPETVSDRFPFKSQLTRKGNVSGTSQNRIFKMNGQWSGAT